MNSYTKPKENLTPLNPISYDYENMKLSGFNYNAHNRNLVVPNPFYKKCVGNRNKFRCIKKPILPKVLIPLIDIESGTPPTEIIKNTFDYIKKQELSGIQEYSPSVGPEIDLKLDAVEVVRVDEPEPDGSVIQLEVENDVVISTKVLQRINPPIRAKNQPTLNPKTLNAKPHNKPGTVSRKSRDKDYEDLFENLEKALNGLDNDKIKSTNNFATVTSKNSDMNDLNMVPYST
ncbi:hypothetical protein AYI70_g4751, partial [Smittium culicis]